MPELVVERIAPVTIEPGNNYTENTRLRIQLVYPSSHRRAGKPVRDIKQPLLIEEWRTTIYDGRHGATRLPMQVQAPEGETEVVLKSLARFHSYYTRNAPVPQVAVHFGTRHALIDVPQWVDEDGDDKTDWLEARVDDILRRARASGVPEIVTVVSVLGDWRESYKLDCGGFVEKEPRIATISTVCIDWDGINAHRVNMDNELTATVLHEIRHVWVHYQPERDPFKQKLLNAPSGQSEPRGCQGPRKAGEMCSIHIRDERYAAQEADAEAFANKYKDLFP